MKRRFYILLALFTITILLAACQPAGAPTEPAAGTPTATREAAESEPEGSRASTATPAPEGEVAEPVGTPGPAKPLITPTSIVERRMVELEWPPYMRFGDSDAVRLALVPSDEGYRVTTDFPDHQTESAEIQVRRPEGYELYAVARLDGVGFDITPQGERAYLLPVGEAVSWRWTLGPTEPGQQSLAVTLFLRWIPTPGSPGQIREAIAYSKSLDIRVVSFFGLTRRQAMTGGFFGLLFGGGLSLYTLLALVRSQEDRSEAVTGSTDLAAEANPDLVIESPAELELSLNEETLLKKMFRRYGRLVIEKEFPSGYSGARTLLALPIRQDGRADAHTVIKIDQEAKARREYENYETFVKHSLPPMTARIQGAPVVLGEPVSDGRQLAALQYTFIAEPGRMPASLRDRLAEDPNADILEKLFETFGPNWWMQRKPYTFTVASQYDRMLPVHYVVEPAEGEGQLLDGSLAPGRRSYEVGDLVRLRNFERVQRRPDGQSLSLKGKAVPGHPRLRVRWRSLDEPAGETGRIVATRETILRQIASDLDRRGLPDPLAKIHHVLRARISGGLSTIHGDLNLENVMVGPANMVWLIDFATTRDGHTLYDFAHLKAEIIAHVIAPQIRSEREYLDLLVGKAGSGHERLAALLEAVDEIARRCLFDRSQPREYDLAAFMACVGALKFENLDRHQKQLLYLTAARLSGKL